MPALVVIGSTDRYLGANLDEVVRSTGNRKIRTNKLERIMLELKQPERLAVIDLAWEEVQGPGVLKQMVNIARICGNSVVCICPNQDEDLKKLAKRARVAEVFLRYDVETLFREYLNTL